VSSRLDRLECLIVSHVFPGQDGSPRGAGQSQHRRLAKPCRREATRAGDGTSPGARSGCRGSGGIGVRFARRCGRAESLLRAATEGSPGAEGAQAGALDGLRQGLARLTWISRKPPGYLPVVLPRLSHGLFCNSAEDHGKRRIRRARHSTAARSCHEHQGHDRPSTSNGRHRALRVGYPLTR
jgi:hypothetical protein